MRHTVMQVSSGTPDEKSCHLASNRHWNRRFSAGLNHFISALILLQQEGYPCIFYLPTITAQPNSDKGKDGVDSPITLAPVDQLLKLIRLRQQKVYGLQREYWNNANIIGWTRHGYEEHGDSKWIEVGRCHKGKKFTDDLGYRPETVVINADGRGEFYADNVSLDNPLTLGK